jgi:hypothetical protein
MIEKQDFGVRQHVLVVVMKLKKLVIFPTFINFEIS